jgi:hypothetical protein
MVYISLLQCMVYFTSFCIGALEKVFDDIVLYMSLKGHMTFENALVNLTVSPLNYLASYS